MLTAAGSSLGTVDADTLDSVVRHGVYAFLSGTMLSGGVGADGRTYHISLQPTVAQPIHVLPVDGQPSANPQAGSAVPVPNASAASLATIGLPGSMQVSILPDGTAAGAAVATAIFSGAIMVMLLVFVIMRLKGKAAPL